MGEEGERGSDRERDTKNTKAEDEDRRLLVEIENH